ncbi:hypothetical protein FACS1894103_4120 [Campylobacterota bacterium]|nr:hypothetical protein FACS1894103_4120 [Campylobacterota bacterium]
MIESLFGGSTLTINILGIAGFFAVVLITAIALWVYAKQIKDYKGGDELEEGEWDGIKEYQNPLPVGWAVIFAGLLIWAIAYWVFLYPLNAYSQIGEYNQETAEYNKQFQKQWSNPSEATLKAMGESVFLAQCAQCHGLDAKGNGGRAADLRTKYGGTGIENADAVSLIAQYGMKGDIGTMPSFASAGTLTDIQYQAVATYIVTTK